ncbi:MAG: DNA-protecting protein DprA [Lachnospiraceae bacterium]|jgi:DNA processing protein|nr:DNA-protecting protein DprA [Lachnospiraceae bacterium]
MINEEYNYWLSNIDGIGPRKIELLRNTFGSAKEVFHASRKELIKRIEKTKREEPIRFFNSDIERVVNSRDEEKIHRDFSRLKEQGIQFVTKEDKEYPERLRPVDNAPFALYIKGKLPDNQQKAIAIVGARECTPYGMEITRYLAGALAREGVVILSGMARGIDSYAHIGALKAGGITCAVLGCGIDICYPRENDRLYLEIQKDGAVLSEYAPGIQPLAGNFPMRNRIISGLSDGILVIEAKERSGSLITVDMGLEQGKEIYALPGRITDSLSVGCNNLIKMGAKPITSAKDILEDLFANYKVTPISGNMNSLPSWLQPEEQLVCQCLGMEPLHLEVLCGKTGLPVNQLMEILLKLELQGMIRQPMKNYYVLDKTN